MPFKKLHPYLQEKLEYLKIESPTALQTKSIPVIKSGANVFCSGPKDSGKTTTLILTTMQALKCEAVGNAPRAIVLVENKEKAIAMYYSFITYTKHTSLRVYVGHESLHVDLQKSEIFEGVDILISTPKSLNQLFLLNGFSTAALRMFSVDDAEFLTNQTPYGAMLSLSRSIKRCQHVLYCQTISPKLKRFNEFFMEYAKTVSI